VSKFDSIQILLSIVDAKDYNLMQFDEYTAFLHGTQDEELYMIQLHNIED
jgi:hypothetical protein